MVDLEQSGSGNEQSVFTPSHCAECRRGLENTFRIRSLRRPQKRAMFDSGYKQVQTNVEKQKLDFLHQNDHLRPSKEGMQVMSQHGSQTAILKLSIILDHFDYMIAFII